MLRVIANPNPVPGVLPLIPEIEHHLLQPALISFDFRGVYVFCNL
jgi:hypothetical protein